jgi:hypothetical protein
MSESRSDPRAATKLDVPAGHFAGLVAAGADAAAVGMAGGSAVGVAGDVVDVSDGGVAVGAAAVLVS